MIHKVLLISFFCLSQALTIHAFAKTHLESELLLREALMDSNADYNRHKEKAIHEEMDRADTWVERDEHAIAIGQNADLATQVYEEMREDFIDPDMRRPTATPN